MKFIGFILKRLLHNHDATVIDARVARGYVNTGMMAQDHNGVFIFFLTSSIYVFCLSNELSQTHNQMN